jgi:hypothetical protein
VRPLAACVAGALAAHAAVLLLSGWQSRAGDSPSPTRPAVADALMRMLVVSPTVAEGRSPESGRPQHAREALNTGARSPLAGSDISHQRSADEDSSQGPAPTLGADSPALNMPDAEPPLSGVHLRAWVEVDMTGTTHAVALRPPPEDLAVFESTARFALLQSRLVAEQINAGPRRFCLEIHYRPGASIAEIDWLPGPPSAQAATCLSAKSSHRAPIAIRTDGSPPQ